MEEDAIILAVFLGAGIAFWLLRRSMRAKELNQPSEPAAVPSRPAAFAGRDYWDRYDVKEGWSSSVATEEKKQHLAGGKNGRPLDSLLPRREYVPKKPTWAGSGTAARDDSAKDKFDEIVSEERKDSDEDSAELAAIRQHQDFQASPGAAETTEAVQPQQAVDASTIDDTDDVGWKEAAPVSVEDTASGRSFRAKVQEKAEEGWRLDEKLIARLLAEGFGIRAATRAVLVTSEFDECLLFLFRRLEDGWVNAAWSDDEVQLLGKDWIGRLEELEHEVLLDAAKARDMQRSLRLRSDGAASQTPGDSKADAAGVVGDIKEEDLRTQGARARGAAHDDQEARSEIPRVDEEESIAGSDAPAPRDKISSIRSARGATERLAPTMAEQRSCAAPAERLAKGLQAVEDPVRTAESNERGVLQMLLMIDDGDMNFGSIGELRALANNGWSAHETSTLRSVVWDKTCLFAWGPLQEALKPAAGGAGAMQGSVLLPSGSEYCVRVWQKIEAGEGRALGDEGTEAVKDAVLASVLQALTGLVAEAGAVLRNPSLGRAFLSFLADGEAAKGHSVERTFSRILSQVYDAIARARPCAAAHGTPDADDACKTLAEFAKHPELRALIIRSFEHPPYSPTAEGVPSAVDLLRCSPLAADPILSNDDPSAAEWYRLWFRTMIAVKSALPLKDPAFRRAFLAWTAHVLSPADSHRFSHASTSPLLPNVAIILGLLARPFLAVDSPLHRAWTRFDPSWYSSSGRLDVSLARKLRWWSGSSEVGAATNADDGFTMSAAEADALALAVEASKGLAVDGTDGAELMSGEGDESGGHLVTEVWMLALEAMHRGVVPLHAALKHNQSEGSKAKAEAKATWEAKAAACKLMLGGIGGAGSVAGWGGWEMNYAEAGELFLGVASMAMAWVVALRGSARALQLIPEYVLHDALHIVWCCWMDTPVQFLSSPYSAVALDAFPVLIARAGGLSSVFLRYRFADVVAQAKERDAQEGKSRWDSRMSQLESSHACRSKLSIALAELFADLEGVTPAEAHAFDKNAARGRISSLLLQLLSTDVFLESMASLSPSAAPGASGPPQRKSTTDVDVLVGFLNAVVGDGAFVLEDALGRLADIRGMQTDMETDEWKALPEHIKRDRTNLHRQLEGVAVHFLQLAKTNLALLETLLSHPSIRDVMCTGELGSRFGGYLHLSVSHLCGYKSRQLHLHDPARYGFDPKELVKHLCCLLGKASAFPQVTASLRVSGAVSVYARLLRIATTKLSLDPGTVHALTSRLEPLVRAGQASQGIEDGDDAGEGEGDQEGEEAPTQGKGGERKAWEATADDVEAYKAALAGLAFSQIEMADASGAYCHHYAREIRDSAGGISGTPRRVRRLLQELHALAEEGCLPVSPDASIFIRTDESRMDVVKVLLSGPTGTPYALGLWEFHVFFPETYPNSPPLVHLETTGNGLVRFNPNLYSDGKVCLSLLGTWHGEGWNPASSTLLQVLVSIQSLIMVGQPYFNEPGYELQKGSVEGTRRCRQYNDSVHLNAIRHAMVRHLQRPPLGFEEAVAAHFSAVAAALLQECARWTAEASDAEMAAELRAATAELRAALDRLRAAA